jgi:Tfp pilus assembly protein PilV
MNIVCKYTRVNKLMAARRHSGFNIIEVTLASVLLIVAMVPVLRSLTKANMFSAEIEKKTQALVFAQGKLDEIRARSIYHYSDSFTQTNLSLGNSYLCNITDNGADPLRTVTVSVGRDDNNNGVLSPDEVEVTLATCIARRW